MKDKKFKLLLILISFSIFCYHIFNLFHLWSDIPSQITIHFTDGEPGSKFFLFVMPIISVFIWFLVGLFVRNPEKLNYVNLTEENKDIQYSRTQSVMILIQNVSFMTFIFANEALLDNAVGMESSLPIAISIVCLVICFIAPLYLLVWAATLKY